MKSKAFVRSLSSPAPYSRAADKLRGQGGHLRRFYYPFGLAGMWLFSAFAASYFRGGENLTLGATHVPGVILVGLLRLSAGPADNEMLLLLVGFFLFVTVGLTLDLFCVPVRNLLASSLLGLLLAIIACGYLFFRDVRSSSLSSAFLRLDLNQWDRAAALLVLILTLAFYLGLFFSLGAAIMKYCKTAYR